MTHKTFTDSAGLKWDVWDVVPKGGALDAPDRRASPDRRHATIPIEHPDRRRGLERRISLPPNMQSGWLAFASGKERRRLAPIPPEWEAADERLLEELCRRARPTRRGAS